MVDDVQAETRSMRALSVTSKSSRKKRSNRKRKAKEWTYYIETLKKTCDCLYEMCRTEQSVAGCREASLYLRNADRDFQSLIEAINLEQSFSREEPQAVAWEIRKTISSPCNMLPDKPRLLGALPFSAVVLNGLQAVGAGTQASATQTSERGCEDQQGDDGDGWQVVERRRRSSSLTTTHTEESVAETVDPPRVMSVYERLSSGARCNRHIHRTELSRPSSSKSSSGRINVSRLTCPKSAMDLPQTKASMAKISYCRQRLWETNVQPSLAEKLRAKQRKERISRSSSAMCGLNFKDPEVVRQAAKKMKDLELQKKEKRKCSQSVASEARSLTSICETEENDVIPSDPKPTLIAKSEPPPELIPSDLEGDEEWREMTEEEKSLAMEEQSINMEIEKAESEFETELARQVDAEAAECSLEVNHKKSEPIDENQRILEVQKFFDAMKEELKSMYTASWSEIVEKECNGHYREPGEVVQRHEKMSSPSRRRCDKDDNDFSRRHIERQKKADEIRERLHQARAQKLKELSAKRDEILEKRRALIERKRIHLEKRMERAEENRKSNLEGIVLKAKSDEQKVAEVQFMQSLQHQSGTAKQQKNAAAAEERIQSLTRERIRRNEEKAAKELAVEERRKQAEQDRILRIQERQDKAEARQAQLALERKLGTGPFKRLRRDSNSISNKDSAATSPHGSVLSLLPEGEVVQPEVAEDSGISVASFDAPRSVAAETSSNATLELLPEVGCPEVSVNDEIRQSSALTEDECHSIVAEGNIDNVSEPGTAISMVLKKKSKIKKKAKKLKKSISGSFDQSSIQPIEIHLSVLCTNILGYTELELQDPKTSCSFCCPHENDETAQPGSLSLIKCILSHRKQSIWFDYNDLSDTKSKVDEELDLTSKLFVNTQPPSYSTTDNDRAALALALCLKSISTSRLNRSNIVLIEKFIDELFKCISSGADTSQRASIASTLAPVTNQILYILFSWSRSGLQVRSLEKLLLVMEKCAQFPSISVDIVFSPHFVLLLSDLMTSSLKELDRRFVKMFSLVAISLDSLTRNPISNLDATLLYRRIEGLLRFAEIEQVSLFNVRAACKMCSPEVVPGLIAAAKNCSALGTRLSSLILQLIIVSHLNQPCDLSKEFLCPTTLHLMREVSECNNLVKNLSHSHISIVTFYLFTMSIVDKLVILMDSNTNPPINAVQSSLIIISHFAISSTVFEKMASDAERSLISRLTGLLLPFFIRKELRNSYLATLVAMTANDPTSLELMKKSGSPLYLAEFIEKAEHEENVRNCLLAVLPESSWKSTAKMYRRSCE